MKTPTLFTNLGNLRHQECDRITTMREELLKVGIKAVEGSSWMAIFPFDSTDEDVNEWKNQFQC